MEKNGISPNKPVKLLHVNPKCWCAEMMILPILDRRCKPSMLVYKPIQSNKLKIRMCKFDANSTKNEDVRVPHLKTAKTAVMTSSNVFSKYFRKWNVFYCFPEYLTVTATTVNKTVCEV